MIHAFLLLLVHVALQGPAAGAPRPADIAFGVEMIDPGFSESLAVADFNNDGRLDILSAEYWYEAPRWIKHRIREIPFDGSYIDNFSDLPVDVDGDGYTDVVQIAYVARRIVWLKNPGKGGRTWAETSIDDVGPTEFVFLVDLDNDGRALEILPQFTGAAKAPLTWYELAAGRWTRHVVSSQSHGHGIGAGDVNGDGRNDILTPAGWLEAPADVRTPGEWTLHPTAFTSGAAARIRASEPMGIYWYQFRPGPRGNVEWIRHIVDYGGRAGGGLQMSVVDLDGDGDRDVVTAGKTGLFLSENLTKTRPTRRTNAR